MTTALGCSPGAPQDVTVRWLLADGRSCIDAGVVRVSLATSAGGDPLLSTCPATPLADPKILIPALTSGMKVSGSGLSGSATVLYRGTITIPAPAMPTMDLQLYFTGGE